MKIIPKQNDLRPFFAILIIKKFDIILASSIAHIIRQFVYASFVFVLVVMISYLPKFHQVVLSLTLSSF